MVRRKVEAEGWSQELRDPINFAAFSIILRGALPLDPRCSAPGHLHLDVCRQLLFLMELRYVVLPANRESRKNLDCLGA